MAEQKHTNYTGGPAWEGGMPSGSSSSSSGGGGPAEEVLGYSELFSGMLEAQAASYEMAAEAAIKMSEYNTSQFNKWAVMAGNAALSGQQLANQAMRDAYYGNLARVDPNWNENVLGTEREVISTINAAAEEYLTGELPQDVQNEIERMRAELGIMGGQFGGGHSAANYATARDLGLTSLQLQQYGLGLKGDVMTLASRYGGDVLKFMPPMADPTSLYSTNLSLLAGGGQINPTQALTTAANVGMFNAEMAWNAELSALNAGMDLFSTMKVHEANMAMANAQKTAGIFGGIGSGIGAGIGAYAAFSAISDRRLKRNVRKLGKLLGFNLYSFRYLWSDRRHVGFMAQEVQKTRPDAVFRIGKFLAINYGRLLAGG